MRPHVTQTDELFACLPYVLRAIFYSSFWQNSTLHRSWNTHGIRLAYSVYTLRIFHLFTKDAQTDGKRPSAFEITVREDSNTICKAASAALCHELSVWSQHPNPTLLKAAAQVVFGPWSCN